MARPRASLTDAELWAYGDSAGDAELLSAADHPVWVRGTEIGAEPSRLDFTVSMEEHQAPDTLAELKRLLAQVSDLQTARSVLEWDHQVMMPRRVAPRPAPTT